MRPTEKDVCRAVEAYGVKHCGCIRNAVMMALGMGADSASYVILIDIGSDDSHVITVMPQEDVTSVFELENEQYAKSLLRFTPQRLDGSWMVIFSRIKGRRIYAMFGVPGEGDVPFSSGKEAN